MTALIHLVVIDPQNDFCDLPVDWCGIDPVNGTPRMPALPVAGAHQDMLRLARLIDAAGEDLSVITITLDSHHRVDIAHPTFWVTRAGLPVQPFTQITAAQLRSADYRPRDASALPRAQAYLDELERRGRYSLMVWPVHCEIGSWGHNVHPAVKAAYNRWEELHQRVAGKLGKGSNPWTEHYSAVRAEVPDANDPSTQLNLAWLAELDRAELIVIAGEAGSHCVRATTEDIADHLPSGRLDKLVLLTDCMSPVGSFEAEQQAFVDDMRKRGLRLSTSIEVLAAFSGRRTGVQA